MKQALNAVPCLYGTLASMSREIEANPDSKSFRLCTKVSARTIALVLSRTKAKRLIVSKTINSSLSPSVKSALRKVGVALVVANNLPGRLKARSVHSRFRKARNLVMHGMHVNKACAKIGISRRTYYYALKSEVS